MGDAQYPTIKNVKVSGTVIGNGGEVGGLTGGFRDATMENCYSEVIVENSSSNSGGLIGYCYSSVIKKCASNSVVNGQNSSGGLIGTIADSNCEDVYSSGTVSGGSCVGGLFGKFDGKSSVTNSFSVVTVSTEYTPCGGIAGYLSDDSTIENSYWCKDLAGVETSAGGEELTLEQMKKQESYVGFDFTSESPIWVMKEYPELNCKFGEK